MLLAFHRLQSSRLEKSEEPGQVGRCDRCFGSPTNADAERLVANAGATDGIGKAYCEALASRGLNILLISRTVTSPSCSLPSQGSYLSIFPLSQKSKLETVAAEIKEQFKVETKIVAADFSKINDAGAASCSQPDSTEPCSWTLINNFTNQPD